MLLALASKSGSQTGSEPLGKRPSLRRTSGPRVVSSSYDDSGKGDNSCGGEGGGGGDSSGLILESKAATGPLAEKRPLGHWQKVIANAYIEAVGSVRLPQVK